MGSFWCDSFFDRILKTSTKHFIIRKEKAEERDGPQKIHFCIFKEAVIGSNFRQNIKYLSSFSFFFSSPIYIMIERQLLNSLHAVWRASIPGTHFLVELEYV